MAGPDEQIRRPRPRAHPAVLAILLLIAVFYHGTLGLQVVIEDYVSTEWVKIAALVAMRLVSFALAVAGIFAVLRIAFGG